MGKFYVFKAALDAGRYGFFPSFLLTLAQRLA